MYVFSTEVSNAYFIDNMCMSSVGFSIIDVHPSNGAKRTLLLLAVNDQQYTSIKYNCNIPIWILWQLSVYDNVVYIWYLSVYQCCLYYFI